MLTLPLPALDDPEGDTIPERLPFVVDAHVHLFPDPMFAAIWDWFDRFGWPIRYRFGSERVVEFLLSRGVGHIVGLHYAHRPGMARDLNRYMAALARAYPQVTGLATIFPGEPRSRELLEEAADLGLAGVKLHAHVQFFEMDSPDMHEVYFFCEARDWPMVMHVGREPKNPHYPYLRDPYEICGSDKVEQVLRQYPGLRICVPHMGADEFAAFASLVERYDNLWLDTTMVLADYLPVDGVPALGSLRADRIMYGTDFPNIPYAWDRELGHLLHHGLDGESLSRILGGNALKFFGLALGS